MSERVRWAMGLSALGYGEGDIPALVEGALKQQRILVNSPRNGARVVSTRPCSMSSGRRPVVG